MWTDPRLLLGVLVVLVSTVLGAAIVAAGDETVGYWAVRETVRSGDPVSRGDLVETRARLAHGAERSFLRTDEDLPASLDQLTWGRDVEAGALVERSALAREGGTGSTELPLAVAFGAAPDDLRRGDRVDVWVGPAPGEAPAEAADRVLGGVRVVSTGSGARAAGAATRTVLVDVGDTDLDGDVVAALAARHVTLVRLP